MTPQVTEQYERLKRVAADTAGWGVLIYMEYPGDVPFLAPILPALRGHEIVAADPDGGYDVWLHGQPTEHWNMTLTEVAEWLRPYTPPDAVLEANCGAWATETMDFYGVQKR